MIFVKLDMMFHVKPWFSFQPNVSSFSFFLTILKFFHKIKFKVGGDFFIFVLRFVFVHGKSWYEIRIKNLFTDFFKK